jgi:hypothetical protein
MKKFLGILIFIACFSAYATPVNITSTDLGGTEDDAVSAGCETGNSWDLESTILDGTKLSIVASYDLKNGYDYTSIGDIFIDIDGNATNHSTSANTFSNSKVNYDYAIRINYSDNTYTVYKLNSTSTLSNVGNNYSYQGWLDRSNNSDVASPYKYVGGGTVIGTYTLTYQTGLSDNSSLGYTSWESKTTHNEITVDLANLGLASGTYSITSHFTITCGNDVAVGKGTISVPEPGSFSMILMGLLSLGGFAISRKRK